MTKGCGDAYRSMNRIKSTKEIKTQLARQQCFQIHIQKCLGSGRCGVWSNDK